MAQRAEGIADVMINDQQAQNALKGLQEQAGKLNDKLHEMRKANDKLGYDKTKKELDAVNKEMKGYHKTNTDVQKVLDNLSGSSYNQLLKVQKQLRNEMRGMKRDTDEQKKAFEQKAQSVKKVDTELSKLQKDMKMGSADFSQYAGNMATSLQQMGVPIGPLQMAIMKLTAAKKALAASQTQLAAGTHAASAASTGFTKVLRILRIALISTGIGAIAVALGALAAALFSTQRGTDMLNKVLIPLRTIFERMLGLIQDLGWRMIDAFKNPKQAVSDLWEFIKSQIVNRIDGLKKMFIGLGKVISSAMKLDWAGVKEGATELGDAYLQTMTGVEDVVKKAADAFNGLAAEISQANKDGERLAEIKVELEELAIEIAKNEGRLNREYQEQYMTLIDINKSEKERRAAGEAAIKAAEQQRDFKLQELELQIEEAQIKAAQNDTDRAAFLELAKLEAERENFQAQHLASLTRLQRQLNTLKKEDKDVKAQQDYFKELEKLTDEHWQKSLSRDERELVAIDRKYEALYEKAVAANQDITELQEMHANELIEKQKEIEERTQQELLQIKQRYGIDVSQELMDAEMAILQKHYDNKLLSEEEFQQARKSIEAKYQATSENTTKKSISKIKAWEDADADEKIARVQGLLSTAQGLFKENTTAYKILATANATMDTYKAATLALSSYPPPFNFIAMGTTIAAGLAQVAKINAVQFASGKYDVIGATDGRTYRAGMVPQAATGIYPEPTLVGGLGLVGEKAPELVVDGPTLKNIQLNAPEIIAAIQAMRVPQYATGNYPPQTMPPAGGAAGNTNAELLMLVRELIEVNKRPTRAKIVYSDLEDVQDEMDDIKNDFSK